MAKKYTLPALEYAYSALEPVISTEALQLHHQKHHNGYVGNLNTALEKYAEAEKQGDLETMISIQPFIRFNGGGHLNHAFFWTCLAPKDQGGGEPPQGSLSQKITAQFGSLEKFIEKFNSLAVGVQGSGWSWLGFCPFTKVLTLLNTTNHDLLKATTGLIPLLCMDVWEHAYYLQYKNLRGDYLKEIWKVVNWAKISERYEQACKEKIVVER